VTEAEIRAILRYFAWEHLPPQLQVVSQPFGALAHRMVETLPTSGDRAFETLAGLRRLLEAKDCAVRAAVE
jgi:hypothetical protein